MIGRITRIEPFWQAILCMAMLGTGFSGGEEANLPADLVTSLGKLVHVEIDNRAITVIGKGKVHAVRAYEGSAGTHDVQFVYQIFPELGIFRILPTGEDKPDAWLYMSCGGVDPENAVKTTEKKLLALDARLRERILSCASGVIYRDITAVDLTCHRLDNHLLYSQEVKWFLSGIGSVRILMDPQHKVMAITSGTDWRSIASKATKHKGGANRDGE